MGIDFERDYGVNAGYVQGLYEAWRADPGRVDTSWRQIFERLDAREALPREESPPPEAPPPPEDLEPLRGLAGRIAANMERSLGVPTATSVRTVPAKLLDENRRVLNEHLSLRALGKASYTHIVAFALVRALRENPALLSAHVEHDGRAYVRRSERVHLGIAVDVPSRGGRALLVPCVQEADRMTFTAFRAAYDELVERGRGGKLAAEDFQGTNVTLTNPGGFGTTQSAPRLMEGQGLIVATGSIAVPPELAGMSRAALAEAAIGPVVTVTSTYDHRVIQGAESGLLLKRLDELLQGADGFYDELFADYRVPWRPWRAAEDRAGGGGVRADSAVQAKVWALINAYRWRGCTLADLDPLAYDPDPDPTLDPGSYGFTVWDLDRTFVCGDVCGRNEMTLREVLQVLRGAYCRRWTVEYMHITDLGRKHWIRSLVEQLEPPAPFPQERRLRILDQLSRAENLERFLHARYVGNKRFSLEGGDTLIPALAALIDRAAENGVERVVIGMAHRGRLNVLHNILGRDFEALFRDFEGVLLPLSSEGSGDVKYHLGQRGTYRTPTEREVEVVLAANPSHLEAVDPVVCGMARAHQDLLPERGTERVLAVLVHGDAAFSGQGVVAETLNMSRLRAFSNGGTVHLVVNNQIGFTTGPRDLRSTQYCTDIAKSVQAPIWHANGDYPESVLRAVELAVDYRTEFGEDAAVDIVCYRRWGHNEGDEPAFTQPLLYARIREHPTVREHYTQLTIRRGALTREEADEYGARYEAELRAALERFREAAHPELPAEEQLDLSIDDPLDYTDEPSPDTGVPAERLVALVERTNAMPTGHVVHPNLLRQLRRREEMARGERPVDWGCAEALAFGSLLEDGVSIRLSGQDSGRGTFSHRHAVIRDQVTEAEHVPLRGVAQGGTTFDVYDSLLSEEAVLAFEYGYSVVRERALVLWEAQFGDFVNGAQVPIDQFLVPGESKWRQRSGLVLLLPHGYDGQGPEHSSARPERFLQLCASGNLVVASCSTAAQYFHLLRRHATESPRCPLVVLSPKSLLRDQAAASGIVAFTAGPFRELIPDPAADPARVTRLVLCSGKIAHELSARRTELARETIAIARLEQLYPFPRAAVAAELERFSSAELVWCQEEPANMGAWTFAERRLRALGRESRYAGRAESPSPATGSFSRHRAEQEHVLRAALG